MSIDTRPNPDPASFHSTFRSQWSINKFSDNCDRAIDVSNGVYLPTEAINPWRKQVVFRALVNSAIGNTFDPNLEVLRTSDQWNKLASGDMGVLDHDEILMDEGVSSYLDKRTKDAFNFAALVKEQYPDIARAFISGVKQGRRLGYIPTSVTDEELEMATKSVGLQVKDGAILSDDESTFWGTYDDKNDVISISTHSKDVKGTIIHELRHRISGGTFLTSYVEDDPFKDPYYYSDRTRIGFQEKSRHRAIDEALTEHTALAISNGQWDVLDPRKREDVGSYKNERLLLADLIEKSGGIVNLETLSKASFEDTDPKNTFSLRRQMMREIRKAYGPGALPKFDRLADELVHRASKAKSASELEAVFSCIHGPEFDDSGMMIRRGRIDEIEHLDPAA